MGMRHLLLAATMIVFGLTVTLGTASVLQDVAVARSNGVHGDAFEVTDMKPASTKRHATSTFAGDRLLR